VSSACDFSLSEAFIRFFKLSSAEKFMVRNLSQDYLKALDNDAETADSSRNYAL